MAQFFISYSRENTPIVERLRQDLLNAGLNIWIDKIGLQPGTPDWDEALRLAIRQSDAVILVASPDSRRSAYVRDEIALAKDAKKPIYPVWVDGDKWIDAIPMGLGSTQNVDLRADAYAHNLTSLIAALSGQAGNEPVIEPVIDKPTIASVSHPRNPYKGLRAFRAEDASDFFGRDTLIETLLEAIAVKKNEARLLAVLGASGSGKSSVIMAGVLPKLHENHPDWTFLDPIVPSANPLEKLTITLARQLAQKTHAGIREDLLDRSTRGLHRLTCEISDRPIVLYIDQFEEVFTLVEQESERRQFIDLLTTAVTEPDGVLYILLSMRADFYDRPLQYNAFGGLIEKQHLAITPMTLADLYDVVQKPAQLPDVGLQFEEGLVMEMVFAVREEAAALPLLQFTLDQLFERRDGNTLTMDAYEAIGGVQGALAQHAEATYNSLPSSQHKELARALFLRLIEAGQTEQDTTRRRASYSELTLADMAQTKLLQEVADRFVDARLLVSDQSGAERTLEVSHEALIREWGRLGAWLHDAREDLRLQKSLAADVAEWKRRNQPDDMLYRGTVLAEAQVWMERNHASRDETLFLNASAALEAQRHEQEKSAARRLRYLGVSLIAVILLVSLSVAAYFALQTASLKAQAEHNEAQANWVATRAGGIGQGGFPPIGLSQTPALDFYATSTAEADLVSNWQVVSQEFNCDEGYCVEMVLVPAGCFWMGSMTGYTSEQPVHEICIETDFWIDHYEVTNEQFEALGGVAVEEADWHEPLQPRSMITWYEARDYCALRGASLATEAQWEYAARGPNSLVYPWGNEFVEDFVNYFADEPSVVGSHPEGASWVGVEDMAGNVLEWTSTAWRDYPYDAEDGREDLEIYASRVLRGGSFKDKTESLRSANRNSHVQGFGSNYFGIRCVLPDIGL